MIIPPTFLRQLSLTAKFYLFVLKSQGLISVVPLGMRKLGWSARRIARLRLPTSHNTVSVYFSEGCELVESGKLTISPKVGWMKKVILAGKPKDVSYLYSKVHESPTGGGKRIMPHIYDSEYKDNFYEKK